MKTFYKYTLAITGIFLIISCKKESENDNSSILSSDKVFLSKSIVTPSQNPEKINITTYEYDDKKRIKEIRLTDANSNIYISKYTYNGNGTFHKLVEPFEQELTFYYLNDRVSHVLIVYKDYKPDTLYYYYNDSGKISKLVNTNTHILDMIYDESGRIIERYGNSATAFDTTYYKWANGNLTSVRSIYQKKDYSPRHEFVYEYEHDNRTNYFETKHFPREVIELNGITSSDGDRINKNNWIAYTRYDLINNETYINQKSNMKYSEYGFPIKWSHELYDIEFQYIIK